jgi:hypothetical protein
LHNGARNILNDHRRLAAQIQLDHAFTGDLEVLELKAPDHGIVGRFDERGQDA